MPLRCDRFPELLDRLGGQLIGEDCLLEMLPAVAQHVRYRRIEVVADVGAEKTEHAFTVAARHERVDDKFDRIAGLVVAGQPQPAEFAEQLNVPFGGTAVWDQNKAYQGNQRFPGAVAAPQRWYSTDGTTRSLWQRR